MEHLRGIASMEPVAHSYPIVWDAVDCISLLLKQAMVTGQVEDIRIEHMYRYSQELSRGTG